MSRHLRVGRTVFRMGSGQCPVFGTDETALRWPGNAGRRGPRFRQAVVCQDVRFVEIGDHEYGMKCASNAATMSRSTQWECPLIRWGFSAAAVGAVEDWTMGLMWIARRSFGALVLMGT